MAAADVVAAVVLEARAVPAAGAPEPADSAGLELAPQAPQVRVPPGPAHRRRALPTARQWQAPLAGHAAAAMAKGEAVAAARRPRVSRQSADIGFQEQA